MMAGAGAAGRDPRPVHAGRGSGSRGHQPHTETTQEGQPRVQFTHGFYSSQ